MDTKDVLLITVAIIMIGMAMFSKHYKSVFNDFVGITVMLMVPVFMIILALSIFAGPKVISFIKLPGVKPVFIILITIMILGAFTATIGNDLNNTITGNSAKATDVIFTREALNVGVIMIIGLITFFMVLGTKTTN